MLLFATPCLGKIVENAAGVVVYWKHWDESAKIRSGEESVHVFAHILNKGQPKGYRHGETMTTREEALQFGMTFPDVYQDMPFHDTNWVLVRCKHNHKAFLWTYEYEGTLRINIKVDPAWRDFWRQTYEAVLPGYHQNKEHWNTVILDGTIPDEEIRRMIAESYDLVAGKKGRKGRKSHEAERK